MKIGQNLGSSRGNKVTRFVKSLYYANKSFKYEPLPRYTYKAPKDSSRFVNFLKRLFHIENDRYINPYR